jgi:hypothetical protein
LLFQSSTIVVNNLAASNNNATTFAGAMAFYESNATLDNMFVTGNHANSTGGIGFTTSNVTVRNSTFEENGSKQGVRFGFCYFPYFSIFVRIYLISETLYSI